jgi:hypothetical protein
LQAGEDTARESTDHLQSAIYFVRLKNKDVRIIKKVVVAKYSILRSIKKPLIESLSGALY